MNGTDRREEFSIAHSFADEEGTEHEMLFWVEALCQ